MSLAERDLRSGLWVAVLAVVALVLAAEMPRAWEGTLLFALVLALTWAIWRALAQRTRYLRTIGNLLEALREGDYGVRGATPRGRDDFAAIVRSFNQLAERLQDEQRDLQQSLQLLSKTLAALDGAVFTFEQDRRLRLVNPAGERLLGRPAQALLGHDAAELGLAGLFELPSGSIHAASFAGGSGRWQISHALLRSRSQSGHLLLLQPMERALREEEAQAFRKLLRVLSHEINNSMAPIGSMANTLQQLLPPVNTPVNAELDSDLRQGLELIDQRSHALQRFIGGYARLAKLPPPQLREVALAPLCERVQQLLSNARVALDGGPNLILLADPDQLEQVLINLLRNALEAGGDGPVVLRWRRQAEQAQIEIVDCGQGLPDSGNLFVPFFTTKPNGAGIGLALSRQILEAQSGHLELLQREGTPGAVAQLNLLLHPNYLAQGK